MSCIKKYPCSDCALPNCNGQSHNGKYLYPTCDACGIELLNLCEEQFTQHNGKQNHINLLEHFKNASNKIYCIQCDENYTENDSTCNKEPTVFSLKTVQSRQRSRAKSKSTQVFACRICDSFKSSDRSVRNAHEIAEHQDPATNLFGCPDCGKWQTTVYKIQSHRMQHKPERKPFVCNVCDMCFAERAQLKSHHLTHTTERPYKCNQCGRAYKQSTKLKLHQRSVHEGLRPYKCDQCDSTFKECSDLRRHRRVHGGIEKTHQCEICSKRFYELKTLRVHIETHRINVES